MIREDGVDAVAKRLGVSRRTVFNWKSEGIPLHRIKTVEAITGIPRHELRPDLWEAPQPERAA